MQSRAFLFLALVVSTMTASCPREHDDAGPDPQAAQPLPTPVIAAPPAAAPSAAPQAPIDPTAELPAELQDDGRDDAPDLEPPPPPKEHPTDKGPELASIAKETWIYAEPRWSARRIGYLRAGAVVERRAEPTNRSSCPEGWYRVEPKGYVCVGGAATLNLKDPIVLTSQRRPSRDTLPYPYVMSRFPTPPFYARLPSQDEALKYEPDLKGHLREIARMQKDPSFVEPPPADPIPDVLLNGHVAPGLGTSHRTGTMIGLGRARTRSGFALLSTFDHDGRRYGLTTELAVLPIDRTRVIKPSSFHGIRLDDDTSLPVAFVKLHHATRYVMNEHGGMSRGEPLSFREAVPLAEGEKRIGGELYLEAKDGTFIKGEQAVKVERIQHPPSWSKSGRKWIDVSILHQSLIAYEGTKPVYVTLVSTGADGLGDPKKTHSTIQGAFLIHTKHVSVTMDGDRVGDEFDFRDVPFVQYFTEGFALHAAYWHDDFGTPRSHGCVNLAPIDAAWLFNWTDPDVPAAWHGALTLRKGTLVYTHP